eukprot:scaffold27589_cov104-Isochrysis_galbana.AAC.3
MLAAVGLLLSLAALRCGLPARMMATEASSRAAAAVELPEEVPKSRHVFCNREHSACGPRSARLPHSDRRTRTMRSRAWPGCGRVIDAQA